MKIGSVSDKYFVAFYKRVCKRKKRVIRDGKELLALQRTIFETIADLNNLVSKEEIHKYGRSYHVNLLAKNKTGLKNLFKIISLANTKYLYKTPRILRSEIENHREGLLVGSGCYESEVFREARSKSDEELTNIINFYDYVEVQPPECYDHLIQMHDFDNEEQLLENIKKVIRVTKDSGKLIVATGDVHHLKRENKIYREIIVNQKVPGGGRHPLAKSDITDIPSNHFRTTDEMMEDFSFLDDVTRQEIVITNPNKILDMVEEVEVIIDTGGIPFSPAIDRSVETVTELVYTKASSWYGDPLPFNIEERIAKELYGDLLIDVIKKEVAKKDLSKEEAVKELYRNLHEVILAGFDQVKDLVWKDLKEVMRKVPLPEFRLTLADKGNFGNILWAGVKGNQKLKTYVRDLRAALAAAGIPCEKDKFVPHITLIRKFSAKKPYQFHMPKAEMTVKKASLMKSEQKNGKVSYKEL